MGIMMLSIIADAAGERLADRLKEFLQLCRKTLADPEVEVAYYTIVTLTHLVRRTGSEEVAMFSQLVPLVLQKIEALAAVDQDKALTAIDIFDELIESEVTIVVPHIKPMVELCIRLSQNENLDDSLRVKSITFLGRLTKLKKKTIVKHKLYIPMIQVIFNVMASQDLPDDYDDEDAEDDNSPALASTQSLDLLALHLPPEKYITALLTQVQPALSSPNPVHQRAAYQALAVSAEGCMESIRSKYLNNFLQILATGIKNEHPAVKNAALYMLGQFSEYIQPEISNHANDILPVLLEYLDKALETQASGKDKSTTTVSRIFYALETFCENLETKLVPHLELIMTRAARGMSDGFSVRIQELSISLIGAAASATRGAIVPYMPGVMARLEVYLTMTHNDDTQVLLTQSMDTLGSLARAVGKEHFNKEFAEKCFNIGMELVKTNDDPDIRKCAFSLFGSVATVVKEDMGAQLVGVLVDLMLKSIQNLDGLNVEMEDNGTNLPLEDLSDEEDIESEDERDRDLDDMEGVKSVSIHNSFLEEKECAMIALKDLSRECGASFAPYLSQCYDEVSQLWEYPEDDVRSAAIEGAGHFLIAYSKLGTPEGESKFNEALPHFLDMLATVVKEETEHQIVISALDIIGEILKQTGQSATRDPANIDKMLGCVKKVIKKECACQDVEAEDGDEEEEAEQDEMLFEYAGEIIPSLGKALTPQSFAPYFTGMLPTLLKKTKKTASICERSFAVGAIADSIQSLVGVLTPFLPSLLPMLVEMCRDAEDDCRNNGVFALGELLLWGGQEMSGRRETIQVSLHQMLKHETAPRVIDNIIGALARSVIGDPSTLVDDIVVAILDNLPLKEDKDEYDIIFKFFTTLLASQHPSFHRCLPKIVECSAVFYSDLTIDKEKSNELVAALMKRTAASFGPDLETLLGSLPMEQRQMLISVIGV